VIRSSIIPALALAVAASACNSSESAESGAVEPTPVTAESEPAEPEPEADPPSKIPAVPSAVIEYAAALDPLLDLVPAQDDSFIAVRDAGAALELFDAFVGVATPPVLKRFSGDPDTAQVRAVLEQIAGLRDALVGAKVDLGKGMLFLEDDGVLIYGTASDDPSAIKVVLEAMGSGELPEHCVAPTSMPGYAACGDDEAVLAALQPGKHGATLRASFEGALEGFTLDDGNALFRLDAPTGPVYGAIATPPGRMHVVVGLRDVAKELGKYVAGGEPKALGLLGRDGAFIWANVNLAGFEEQLSQVPAPMQNVADTLTGEVFVGGTEGSPGAMLVGVNDPFPASGLVSIASMQMDALRAQLPEGSTIEVEPIDVGGASIPALHLQWALPDADIATMKALGMQPEGWAFSAGKYAGGVFGGSSSAVTSVAGYEPAVPSLDELPTNLAAALRSGDVGFALHLPFDALQQPRVRKEAQAALASGGGGINPSIDPKFLLAAYDIASPLSSHSMWLASPADARVLHVSFEAFGDASTDEGRAALEAVGKVAAGGSAEAIYGALADAYPSSPRSHRYALRAGRVELSPAAMSASFLLGVTAGVSVPAFTKYVERAEAAQAEVTAAQKAMIQAQDAATAAPR